MPAENVPDGAVRGGFEYRTVRDVAFFAEEVVYELEVWKLPGGARHGAANGYCTVVGNDLFTHFRSTGSKSRLNFPERPSAGEAGFLVNDAALGYMRRMNLPEKTVSLLAGHPRKRFSGADAWGAHLSALGIAGMKTLPDPAGIASEGGLWGAISEGGRIAGTVVPGDDAGQFNVGDHHALCRVHAERLVRKLPCSTGYRLSRVEPVVAGIWDFYAELSEYRDSPREERKAHLSARFDEVFTGGTGYASLDGLLSRLAANKDELLRVLDHPETPLHTNGAERDIRAHAARRKISFGTRSEKGRSARDGYLGAMKTCAKLGVPLRDYLASRFGVAGAPDVPRLADLVLARAAA
ncbi:MAG: transposase [Albidovulum sp.]|nr:transposase [Albidovulum sp.]